MMSGNQKNGDVMSELLGERIHRLRLKADQSLQDVAAATVTTKAHIWQIEKGRAKNPSMALVRRLADHFKVSLSYLVDEDAHAPDGDDDLKRMFRQAQDLEAQDRAALDAMLQHFLAQKKARGQS